MLSDSSDPLLSQPITGIGCCVSAPKGHATAALPLSIMKSRRLIRSPRGEVLPPSSSEAREARPGAHDWDWWLRLIGGSAPLRPRHYATGIEDHDLREHPPPRGRARGRYDRYLILAAQLPRPHQRACVARQVGR